MPEAWGISVYRANHKYLSVNPTSILALPETHQWPALVSPTCLFPQIILPLGQPAGWPALLDQA